MKDLTERDLAYLAGLVDGEGSIFISRAGQYQSLQLTLTISNTSKAMIDWLVDVCMFRRTSIYRSNKSTRDVYRAGLTQSEARDMLEKLEPYLVAKREQAQVVLKYFIMKGRIGRFTYTDEEEALRLLAREKLQELNGGRYARNS